MDPANPPVEDDPSSSALTHLYGDQPGQPPNPRYCGPGDDILPPVTDALPEDGIGVDWTRPA